MLFNYFEGSNEGIIVREAQMRGSMVKCGERPLEGVGGLVVGLFLCAICLYGLSPPLIA